MKPKAATTLVLTWILLSTGGCPPANRPSSNKPLLPPDIAGTWKARETTWKIALAPNGTVSSAVIDMGGVEVHPNKTSKVEMKDGSISTYKAGNCIVEYTAATRELFVSVEMESIHVVFMDQFIDGNSTDRFLGTVSEDGKQWTTEWIKIFDYGPRFPQDPNDIYADPIVFDKIDAGGAAPAQQSK